MSVSLPQHRCPARSETIPFRTEQTNATVLAEGRRALRALQEPLNGGLELDNSAPAFIGSLFLVRSVRNLSAVLTLCEAGWGPEAQTLLRAMVEDMVTIAYISTDPEHLSIEWLSFENRRLPSREELLAVFEGAAPPERKDRPKYERWTRLSFNGMAKRAEDVVPGVLDYLSYVYPVLSDRAHGNPSTTSLYMRAHSDGTMEPMFQPSGSQIAITVCNAITSVYTTVERVRALGVAIEIGEVEAAEHRAYQACGLHLPQE